MHLAVRHRSTFQMKRWGAGMVATDPAKMIYSDVVSFSLLSKRPSAPPAR